MRGAIQQDLFIIKIMGAMLGAMFWYLEESNSFWAMFRATIRALKKS